MTKRRSDGGRPPVRKAILPRPDTSRPIDEAGLRLLGQILSDRNLRSAMGLDMKDFVMTMSTCKSLRTAMEGHESTEWKFFGQEHKGKVIGADVLLVSMGKRIEKKKEKLAKLKREIDDMEDALCIVEEKTKRARGIFKEPEMTMFL